MRDTLKWLAPATRTGGVFEDGADHYIIAGGRITAHNTALAMSAPFPVDFEACPQVETFRAAVDAAKDAVTFEPGHVFLTVRSQGLTVAVPCLAERPWLPLPRGPMLEAPEGFLEALERVQPFIGVDTARRFVCQALIAGGTITATNGISAIQVWTGWDLPPIHVPDFGVKELLKLKGTKAPKLTHIQPGPSDVTYHFEGERWLRVRLYEDPFPWETVAHILDSSHAEPQPVPEGLKAAVERLAPFCGKEDKAIYMRDGGLGTHRSHAGAFLEFPGLPPKLAWSLKPLEDTLGVAQRWDLTDPGFRHHFYGDKLRGVTLGRKW